MQRSIFAAAVFALTLVHPALAQPPRGPAGGEGGPPRRLFISPSGEPFRMENGLAVWFAQADADHDGVLTAQEMQADAKRFFAQLDVNHDGVLGGFEIQAYEQKIVPEITRLGMDGLGGEGRGRGDDDDGPRGSRRGGMGGEDGGMGGIGGDSSDMHSGGMGGRRGGKSRAAVAAGREGASRFGLLNEPQPITGADTDIDGKVTATEWTRATTRRFDRLDRDKSERLTLDGLRPTASK